MTDATEAPASTSRSQGANPALPAEIPRTSIAPASADAGSRIRTAGPIASLYYRVASQRLRDDPIALQFVSAEPGAGVSLVASQFATFAARSHGTPALLVDCGAAPGARARPGLIEAYVASGSIEDAIEGVRDIPGLHLARLTSRAETMQVTGEQVTAVLAEARRLYHFTALDTPALGSLAYSLIFARPADGVVIVAAADRSKATQLESAVEVLERSGAKILGVVFNKRRFHMPRWLFNRL